jgi:hypothetical protein
LAFDRDQASNAIFKGRKIPFDINIHIGCPRIDHWISLKDRHVLHFKEVFLDGRLQDSQIEGLARAQFARVELAQSVVKPPQPGELGVEGKAAVIADFAVVLVQPQSGPFERVRGKVAFDIFLGYRFVLGVASLGGKDVPAGETDYD